MALKIKNYNEIMTDMLARIPDDFDKGEGGIIYDALAPAALELNAMYFLAQDIFKLAFVNTSEGEYLTELSYQFGINRLQATKAVRSAKFNINVAIGTRFSITESDVNFIVIEKRSADYLLECETAGVIGNTVSGFLIPIDYVSNLNSATIGDVVILGEDEETDESLRARTLAHITRPEQDGNIYQYEKWASEFVGIGNATVIPLWNGANTVKVVITDADGNSASAELVKKFQDFLDPGATGKGEGKAPIGAIVTVASATLQKLTLAIKITLNAGYTLEQAQLSIHSVVERYVRKATTQKAFKKYEVATQIDALKEVDYIVSISGTDVTQLNASSIFVLNSLAVTL